MFSPASLTIAPGDIVRWVWVSGIHSVTSDTGAWPEAIPDSSGDEFTHTFTSEDSFPYHCKFHVSMGMTGSVTAPAPVAAPEAQTTATLLTFVPNPVRDQLTVTYAANASHVNVWNMLGQQVYSQAVNPATTENKAVLQLGNLPAGIYIIGLQNKEGVLAKNRFLKVD